MPGFAGALYVPAMIPFLIESLICSGRYFPEALIFATAICMGNIDLAPSAS
jgi:hypothetical protein